MIDASVVVASFRPRAVLGECIASVAPQCRAAGAELLVVRRGDPGDVRPAKAVPLRHVEASADDDVPRLRGRGMREARGRWVVVTEDHCLAEPGWLEALLAAAREGADVVGGGMGNAATRRAVDWAAYFSEYGFFSSARRPAAGPPLLTGANVAYSRAAAADAARWYGEGLWENVVHERLRQRGLRLRFEGRARMRQSLTYDFGAFCGDRYRHGRDYARARLAETGTHPLYRLLTTPLLPALLTARVARTSFRESPLDFLRALPVTVAFLGSWAAGEASGYLAGPARPPTST